MRQSLMVQRKEELWRDKNLAILKINTPLGILGFRFFFSLKKELAIGTDGITYNSEEQDSNSDVD